MRIHETIVSAIVFFDSRTMKHCLLSTYALFSFLFVAHAQHVVLRTEVSNYLSSKASPYVRLEFDTELNRFYQIESSTDLMTWNKEGSAIVGTGARMAALAFHHGESSIYYRIGNNATIADVLAINPYGNSGSVTTSDAGRSVTWNEILGKPSTLAEFGIADAASAAQGRKIDNFLVDVRDFGAVSDIRITYDCVMEAGNIVLTSPSHARFRENDVGKAIRVSGAGPGGEDLLTTIVNRVSPSQVRLAEPATTTVTNSHVVFGTDSSKAVQAAIDSAAVSNVPIVWLPKGLFMFNVELKNGVTIRGSGANTSALTLQLYESARIDETLVYPTDSRRPVIHAQYSFNSQIEHLTIMGNPARTTIGVRIGIPWSHQWLDGVAKPGRMNGDWWKKGYLNGKPTYETVDAGEATRMFWDGSAWIIERDIVGVGKTLLFSSSQNVATPDQVTSWTANSTSASGSPIFRRGVGFVAQGFKISRCNLNAHRIAFQIMRSADTVAEFVTVGHSEVGFFCGDQDGVGAGDGTLFIACTSNFTENVFKFNLTKQASVLGGNFNHSKTFARIDEADVSFSNINIEDCTDQVFELRNNGALVVNTVSFLRHPATGPTVAIKGSNTYVRIDGTSGVRYFATPGTMNNPRELPAAAEVRIYSDTRWTTLLETREFRRLRPQFPEHLLPRIREEFATRQDSSPLGHYGWTLTNISGTFIPRPSQGFKDFGRIQDIVSIDTSSRNLCRLTLSEYQVWSRNSFECGWTLGLGSGDVSKSRFRCGLYSLDVTPSFSPRDGIGVRVDRALPDTNLVFEVIQNGVATDVDTGIPFTMLTATTQLVISRTPYDLRLVIRDNGFPTGTPKAQVSHSTAPHAVMLAPMLLLGASAESLQGVGIHSFYYVKYPD